MIIEHFLFDSLFIYLLLFFIFFRRDIGMDQSVLCLVAVGLLSILVEEGKFLFSCLFKCKKLEIYLCYYGTNDTFKIMWCL